MKILSLERKDIGLRPGSHLHVSHVESPSCIWRKGCFAYIIKHIALRKGRYRVISHGHIPTSKTSKEEANI